VVLSSSSGGFEATARSGTGSMNTPPVLRSSSSSSFSFNLLLHRGAADFSSLNNKIVVLKIIRHLILFNRVV